MFLLLGIWYNLVFFSYDISGFGKLKIWLTKE